MEYQEYQEYVDLTDLEYQEYVGLEYLKYVGLDNHLEYVGMEYLETSGIHPWGCWRALDLADLMLLIFETHLRMCRQMVPRVAVSWAPGLKYISETQLCGFVGLGHVRNNILCVCVAQATHTHTHTHTHTCGPSHTHTHIYIYIYIYVCVAWAAEHSYRQFIV